MVASTPATLEDRIKNWKTRIEDVEDEEDKEIVEPALKLVIAKEKELGNDAITVDQLMEKAKKTDDTKDDIKAEKIDDKLENEQQKLSTSIAILFDYLGDVDSKVKNHTGKLLSQDALVKSGDKKLKLKTSTKDLSFVGHRAKETVSNKTGIIVSSKEGNNYTKAIDDGKKSVEDEYKKLNKITNIEERRKTIGHVPEHDKFKPIFDIEEEKTLPNGNKQIKYRYGYEKSTQIFTAEINQAGYPIKIVGDKLTLHDLGRGITHDPSGKVINAGMDAAHLIGNMFGGSGHKKAENLIATSAEYNQITMVKAEKEIKAWILEHDNVDHFSMKVDVTFMQENEDIEFSKIKNTILTDGNLLKSKNDDRKELANNPEGMRILEQRIKNNLAKTKQPRVKRIDYLVKLYNKDSKLIKFSDFEINIKDLLFGTK